MVLPSVPFARTGSGLYETKIEHCLDVLRTTNGIHVEVF